LLSIKYLSIILYNLNFILTVVNFYWKAVARILAHTAMKIGLETPWTLRPKLPFIHCTLYC